MNDDQTTSETSGVPDVPSDAFAHAGASVLRNRTLMRAPIWLFRARFGFLFRSRMLLLQHIGRKSGARRYVVLEVIDRPAPKAYVVISGFGDRAQWLRNVRTNPQVQVSVGSNVRARATARVLTVDEAATALDAYTTRHPRAWARFKPILDATFGEPIDRRTPPPMVRLDLDSIDRQQHG